VLVSDPDTEDQAHLRTSTSSDNKMKKPNGPVIWAVLLIVLPPLLIASDAIRLSKVSDEPSANTEPLHLTNGQSDQVLFVQRTVEISDDQISYVEIVERDGIVLGVHLTEEGNRRLGNLTEDQKGRRIAIVVRGVLVAAPLIMQHIPSGPFEISGNLSKAEAEEIKAAFDTKKNG
jgi:preprotein translocase subunit SecD